MPSTLFDDFFAGRAREFLHAAICAALDEDGQDLTSQAVFSPTDRMRAHIVAKAPGMVAGLPIIALVLAQLDSTGDWTLTLPVRDGQSVTPGTVLAQLEGPARLILGAERVALNFLGHLSGIATLTAAFVQRLGDSHTRLLDTRKTLPGLRHAEKYAVRMGGGHNHRMDLAEMLMLKDNHIDRAGSITAAVEAVRRAYAPCPPLVVECRTLDDVTEACGLLVDRVLLDNMDLPMLQAALRLVPPQVESEVSGGVNLETVAAIGAIPPRGPDFVSAGALTHSAKTLDVSLRVEKRP